MYMIDSIRRFANICFNSVQGKDTLLQQHNEYLNGFADSVKKSVNISTFSSKVDILSGAINENLAHHEGANMTSRESLSTFVEILDSYPLSVSDQLRETDSRKVFNIFSMFLLKICTNVESFVALRETCLDSTL